MRIYDTILINISPKTEVIINISVFVPFAVHSSTAIPIKNVTAKTDKSITHSDLPKSYAPLPFNFNNELTDENDLISVQLNIIFFELQDIYTSTFIFRVVDSEWDKKVREKDVPNYSTARTILYESLIYRVILGLSKIFENHKEYSLSKAANQIEQIYKNNSEVKSTINEICQKIDSSPMIPIIRAFRDKLFAHLDKENVLSYFRIEPTLAMKYIDCDEIEEWLSLISKLYKTCFGTELTRKSQMPSKDDIIYTFFWR